MYKKIIIIILPLMIISAIIVWARSRLNNKSDETIYITSDYITLNSVSDLTQQSDIVVLGTVTQLEDEQFNTARNTRDPSQPASDLYIKGAIYDILVEQYLKGSGGSEIRILQSENITLPSTYSEGSTVNITDDFIPIAVDGRYVFFLSKVESYPDSPFPDLFSGTAEPYRFRIENGIAKVESPAQLAANQFPLEKEDELIQEIKNVLAK